MITRLKTQKGNIEVRRDFSKDGMTQVRNHSFNHIRVLIKSYRKLNVSSYQKNDRITLIIRVNTYNHDTHSTFSFHNLIDS